MTNAFLYGKVIYYIAVIITKRVTGCHPRYDITLQCPYPNSSEIPATSTCVYTRVHVPNTLPRTTRNN